MALYRQWEKADLSRAIEGGLDALGYASVKPEQLEAIKCLLRGEDVFVSAPTGFGKSLVYQILPLCARNLLRLCGSSLTDMVPLVVVVSPLIALMQDQASKLQRIRNVNAVCLSGASRAGVGEDTTHIFASPEAMLGRNVELLRTAKFARRVVALAIDEAHCIVKW